MFSYLYNIQNIGEEENAIASYSTMIEYVYFNPRNLKNLLEVDELPSLSCITDLHVEDLVNEGTPQIYSLCGRGSRSSLRVLKPGLTVSELVMETLQGNPTAIWTLKGNIEDKHDKYIIISLQTGTMVLGIGSKSKIIYSKLI
jgi:splicing factor 3B subunit 3